MTQDGRCLLCGKWLAIRKDGTLYGHGARDIYDNWCPGSLQRPVEVRDRPRRSFDLEDTDEL